MAKPKKGVLGGFSGKVGTVVGANWNGVEVIKSLPTFSDNRKFSDKQLVQHAKFSLAINFFSTFTNLLRVTFQYQKGQSARSSAFAQFLNNAITGTYPNFGIDYSQVLVSYGKLDNVQIASIASPETGKLKINWEDNSPYTQAAADDQCILAVYCEELNMLYYKLGGSSRSDEEVILNLPHLSGKEVQTWIAFRSYDERMTSMSRYLGAVTIL